MSYTIDRIFPGADFENIVERTRASLPKQGFGILTEIDVKSTLKKKIDADINNYLILGACNPKMAHQAMSIEPRVGAMLPCNVIIRTVDDGSIEVSAIDPGASMAAIDNDKLKAVAGQADIRLLLVIGAMTRLNWLGRKTVQPGSWLARMLERKPKMLVAVALANKMARAIWAMLMKKEDYLDPAQVPAV